MTDMELSPEESRPSAQPVMEQSKYPYGLTIYLDELSLKKLGIKELPSIESYMMLKAKVEVCAISTSENQSGENRSMSLQICEMTLSSPRKEIDPDKLYDKK